MRVSVARPVCFGLILCFALSTPAGAQSNDRSFLEEVTVTARKKDESASTTPISITAFTADALQDAGIVDIRDIAQFTAGLQINGDFGRASERPVIRGIANLRPETAQPVSLFIDGVYVRTGLISSLVEGVERVEVLKGPQAALYGRSTYGGVVNYVTKAPGDELDLSVSLIAAEHEHIDANAYLSAPITETVSGTIGVRHYEFGGEFDNVNDLTAGARDVGSEKTQAFYGSLHIQPNDRLKIVARAYFSDDQDGQFAGVLNDSTFNNSAAAGGTGCPSNVAIPYYCGIARTADTVNIATSIRAGEAIPVSGLSFPVIAAWDFNAGLDREIARYTAGVTYDLTDSMQFQWLGGYTTEDLRVVTNQSYSPTIVGNSFGSFPSAWVTDDKSDREYLSNELRLSGESGDFNWLVGAFLYEEDLAVIDRDILGADLEFDQLRTDEETSFFAQFGWDVNEALSMSFEARQSSEDVESLAVAGGTPLSADFSSFNPRFTIDYQLNDDVFLYGNIARGSKAGGFNAVDPDDPDEAPFLSFDEEVVWQIEAGIKSTLADGRVRLNAALYHLDLTDQQLSQVVILNEGTDEQVQITVVQNVGESQVSGLELDAAWQITDNWFVSGAYALADTQINEGTDATHGGILGDDSLAGFDIPRVSENSANASVQYRHMVNDDWELRTRLDGIYNSSRYAQTHNLQETGDQFDLNLRATMSNENFDVTLWVKNLLDDDAASNVFRYVDPGDFRFFARAYVSFLSPGRQAGLTFRYRY